MGRSHEGGHCLNLFSRSPAGFNSPGYAGRGTNAYRYPPGQDKELAAFRQLDQLGRVNRSNSSAAASCHLQARVIYDLTAAVSVNQGGYPVGTEHLEGAVTWA